MSRHPAGEQWGRAGRGCGHRGARPGQPLSRAPLPGLRAQRPDSPARLRRASRPQRDPEMLSPPPAMPGTSCPGAEPKLATSPLPADRRRQPRLTQSAAVHRLPRQLPLQVGAEEQERVVVRRFPQLARQVSQSGKVQEVGKGTGSGALSLTRSRENKVTGYISRVQRRKGLRPFPSDQGIPRGSGKNIETGRKTSPGETRRKKGQKIGKKELTPTKAES